MILKVDIKKAYDEVDWGFLRHILDKTSFKNNLISLIVDVITSSSLKVCWNGTALEAFCPSQGLRQGDPLSPYLFFLFMEMLHQKINSAVTCGMWQPIHVTKDSLGFSHLFFVDDLLLFREASFSQTKLMEHILEGFCSKSGQKINRKKSLIWVSPNTPNYLRSIICKNFRVQVIATLGTYLVMPLIHERVYKHTYQFVVDRVQKHLATRKMKSLS